MAARGGERIEQGVTVAGTRRAIIRVRLAMTSEIP
jgi:hypothetical protein